MVEALPWWLPDGETGDIDDGPPDISPFMSWRATYSSNMRARDFANAARDLNSFIQDNVSHGEGHALSGAQKNFRHAVSKRVLAIAAAISGNVGQECLRVKTAKKRNKPIRRKISDGALTIQFSAVTRLLKTSVTLANSGDGQTDIERSRLLEAEEKIRTARKQAEQELGLKNI